MKVTLDTDPGCPCGFDAQRQELQLMWHHGHATDIERCPNPEAVDEVLAWATFTPSANDGYWAAG